MLAIIGGTSLIGSSLFADWNIEPLDTPYGSVCLSTDGVHCFLQRHGDPPVPPHRINHRAHISALKMLNVNGVVALNSVGSLKEEHKPGTFVAPHDFISLWDVPTFYDHEMVFTVPEMDSPMRGRLVSLCRDLGMDIVPQGIYVQSKGPRLETKAEIALLRNFGDIIGMTMASEATLCIEAGIPYASLCSVDNYCNGISPVPLTIEEMRENAGRSLMAIELVITRLLAAGGTLMAGQMNETRQEEGS